MKNKQYFFLSFLFLFHTSRQSAEKTNSLTRSREKSKIKNIIFRCSHSFLVVVGGCGCVVVALGAQTHTKKLQSKGKEGKGQTVNFSYILQIKFILGNSAVVTKSILSQFTHSRFFFFCFRFIFFLTFLHAPNTIQIISACNFFFSIYRLSVYNFSQLVGSSSYFMEPSVGWIFLFLHNSLGLSCSSYKFFRCKIYLCYF